jgi:hypothetical protein
VAPTGTVDPNAPVVNGGYRVTQSGIGFFYPKTSGDSSALKVDMRRNQRVTRLGSSIGLLFVDLVLPMASGFANSSGAMEFYTIAANEAFLLTASRPFPVAPPLPRWLG